MSHHLQRLTLVLTLVCGTWLHAHSVHQSTTDAEYNPATQKLEVSLTVFINDLELALMRHSEKLLSFEKTPPEQFDLVIQDYLAGTFVLTDGAGRSPGIEWVGREKDAESAKSDDPAVTLYFQVPVPGELAACSLRHTVFGNIFKDQINLLHLKSGTHSLQLSFAHDAPAKKLAAPAPKVP